jgi:hypothetical protein
MQAANQFTPDQLIVAGRRAEAQGQPAYALQFYRYVADHFPTSTEAYEARDALFRLLPPTEQAAQRAPATGYAQQPPTQAPQQAYGVQQTQPITQQASFGDVRPHAEQAGDAIGRPRADRGADRGTVRDARAKSKSRQLDDDGYEAPVALRPARGYRIGRIVAAMLNTIGWLSLIGTIAMIPLMTAALTVKAFPKGLKENIAGNLIAFGGGTFGLLLIGLFAIFAAQVARATFDTADATRALYEANSGGE